MQTTGPPRKAFLGRSFLPVDQKMAPAGVGATGRPGVTTTVIMVVLVVVIVVAGVGAYVFVFSPQGGPGRSTSTISMGATSSTHTSNSTSVMAATDTTRSTSALSSTQHYQNYVGTFTYVTALGPSGINDSSGRPVEWNSTMTAAGNFTFSVNPSTYTGTGSGRGSITVSTRGYCTGSATVPYTFTITAAHPPSENMIVSFNVPAPAEVTVQLSCQGSTQGFYTANNPATYLSVYPNGLSIASFPYTSSQNLTGGTSYTVAIQQTS